MRAHGLDISKYDIYFRPETATGQLDFVIQRISYRTTRDEAFTVLVPGVMKVPIRGGYHYLNSDRGWKEQADAYLKFISGYDYHFHACDFEAAFNSLSPEFAYQAWQWIHYIADKTGKPTLLYTSPSLYNKYIAPSQSRFGINWNTVDLWQAQWFFTPNPNGTPSTPIGRTAGWKLWQYTDKGNGPLYGVSRSTAADLDVFNGTVQQMRDYLHLSGTTPPPPPEPEPPAEAYTKVRRFNSDVFVVVADPKSHRIHVTDTHAKLETVSSVARRFNAKYVINGDGWWAATPPSPLSLAVSDGIMYQTKQYDRRPFLNITADNKAQIKWDDLTELYNTVSGTRILVQGGTINPALFDTTKFSNIEKHPRTAVGIDAGGRLLLVIVDGRSTVSAGVTLADLARILIEFGAAEGIELDGGGSSAMWVTDQIVNVPSDGAERPVINHLVLGGTTPSEGGNMKYRVIWSRGVARRDGPSTSNTSTSSYAYLNEVDVIADNIPDASDPGNPDKKWVQFADGLYGASHYPDSIGVPRQRMEKLNSDPVPEPTPTKTPFTLAVSGFKPVSGELEPE